MARRFEEACEEAQQWCEANPNECGQIVARRIEMLTPEGIADAIRADRSEMVVASKARPELEFFYQQLLEMQPGLVGGKLPDDGFYFAG